MQVQRSALVGIGATKKQCTSVQSLLLSRQKGGENKKVPKRSKKQPNMRQNQFFRFRIFIIMLGGNGVNGSNPIILDKNWQKGV